MDNAINQNAFVISGSCQGVELSLSATRAIVTTAAQNLILKFDPTRAGAYIAVYRDGFPGKVVSEQLSFTSNLNQNDLVGILQENGPATEIKPVRLLGGVDDNQQGLVIGETYYVQADGSLSTEPDSTAIRLGKAVSETAIHTINLNLNPMKFSKFLQADMIAVGDDFATPGVMINSNGASVQIKTLTEGVVKVQRATDAVNYSDIPYFEKTVNGVGEFNITNAQPGQYVRIVSTVAVEFCNILS